MLDCTHAHRHGLLISAIAPCCSYGNGERSIEALRSRAARVIGGQPLMALEYMSFASMSDATELTELAHHSSAGNQVLASIAVRIGKTRLIDNIVLA